MTNNFSINQGYTTLPTKKEILHRLYQEGHISFDEMWVLLTTDPETRYVMLNPPPQAPYIPPFPNPFGPPNEWQITMTSSYDNGDRKFHQSHGGTRDSQTP